MFDAPPSWGVSLLLFPIIGELLVNHVKTLLLGCGYTLERVAALLPPDTFVGTTRSDARAAALRSRGIPMEVVPDPTELKRLMTIYGGITTVVDSIPVEGGVLHAPIVSEILQGVEMPPHLIYLSTTGVYGTRDGSWVTEETDRSPKDPRAAARCKEEDCYLASLPSVAILRIAGIYGPNRNTLESLKQGRYPRVEGNRWSNRIHVEDLARIITRVIEERALGIFNVADDLPVPSEEVVRYSCGLLGIDLPKAITHEEALSRGMFTLLGNQRVSSSRVKETLDYSLLYPSYREGLSELARAISSHP